jgi:hypothetical protein
MKNKQTKETEVQSLETAQLDEIVGGCNCGCGMANCTMPGCSGANVASRFRFPTFARR